MTAVTKESKQRDKRKRTAFISAPLSTNTIGIRRILERQGIEAFTADQIVMPGCRLSDTLQEAIGRADVVVAIIDSAENSNVFFELGFAQALKKRTLILVDADVESPFVADVGTTFLRTKLDNTQAIEMGVSQLFKVPHHGTSVVAKQTNSIGNLADELLAEVRGDLGPRPEMRLEDILLRAIRASGITASSESGPDKGADIALWSEELAPWISNPLLVECRLHIHAKEELTKTIQQLQRTMKEATIVWALLVYLHSDSDVWQEVRIPQILPMSIEDLLDSMRTKSFAEVIRELRNQRVHGVS
ncbi:hypothetical protein [Symmachiella dynata]|uniref:hypothetical protein n=1 Tax=Symmachiella dynata TaxID=2527995 RepID=UPI0030ED7A65